MKLIVTGAGGFLGREIIRQLTKNNKNFVYALTSQVEQMQNEYSNKSNVMVCKKESLIEEDCLLKNADILINCAFPRGTDGEQLADGLEYIRGSVGAATKNGVKAIINISSQSVYSQKRTFSASEISSVDLESPYAVGKYATELLIKTICTDIPFTNVRLASLIGPGFDQRVTNKLIDSALKSGQLTVMTGEQYFGFLDVEDAARGILKLLEISPKLWKPVYNLGSNRTYSLVNLADIIKRVLKIHYGKNIIVETKVGEAECNTDLDCRLLKEDTGYEPLISMEESILRIVRKKITEYK